MNIATTLRFGAAATLAVLWATAAVAESAHHEAQRKMTQIPHCSQKIGTIAVLEPDHDWWTQYGLGTPEALIKVFVMRSNCFTLLDRGKGLAAMERERQLSSSGQLQGGSNMGGGQIRAADYFLVPDIVSQNEDASGSAITGILGNLVGGHGGALIAGINIHSKTADVVLTITNARTSEQMATIDGHGDKTDVGFGAGGFWGGYNWGAAGVSGYQNTEIGAVVTLAYLDAYSKLVDQLGGVVDEGGASASDAAPQESVRMTKPGKMYTEPSSRSAVVRSLDPGVTLYPTGNKSGLMWEVKDELGHQGWVSSVLFELAH